MENESCEGPMSPENDTQYKRVIEEKDKLIKKQFITIEGLENEVLSLRSERESLFEDHRRLKFELEVNLLKQLRSNESR